MSYQKLAWSAILQIIGVPQFLMILINDHRFATVSLFKVK